MKNFFFSIYYNFKFWFSNIYKYIESDLVLLVKKLIIIKRFYLNLTLLQHLILIYLFLIGILPYIIIIFFWFFILFLFIKYLLIFINLLFDLLLIYINNKFIILINQYYKIFMEYMLYFFLFIYNLLEWNIVLFFNITTLSWWL